MASQPGTDGGGNVDPDTGEPITVTPDIDGKPDVPGQTPGNEPYPAPPALPDTPKP